MKDGPFGALIEWFARNAVAANLLMVILLVGGLFTVFTIKKEIQPRVETNYINIGVPFLGATPLDVEEGVVVKIEEAIQDIEGIEEIVSTASRGYGEVTVEVHADYEVTEVMDEVKNRVDAISTFPENTEKPVISRTQFQQQVLFVSVYGDVDERTLKEYAKQVRNEVVTLPGVTRAEILGGRPYEISIEVSEFTLQGYGLTLSEVAEAVRRAAVGPGASRRSVLNVGGGQPVTTRRLAELCVAAAGQLGLSAPAITSVPQGGETGPDFGLDIGRARRILGWEPQRELADGLRELVAAAGK